MYDISKLDPTVQRELRYCGILNLINSGCGGVSPRTGKQFVVWDAESNTSDHGQGTETSVHWTSPYCKVIKSSINGSLTLGYTTTYEGVTYTPEQFIEKQGVKVITRSIGGPATEGDCPESVYWNKIRDRYKVVIFNSFGNKGSLGPEAAFPAKTAWYISACGLNDNGVPVRKTYSSIGIENDFINFTGNLEGTSFSSPWTAGEAVDLICKYDDDMTHEEVGQFFIWICKDVVRNSTTMDGNGLPMFTNLPNCKYISFTVGDNKYNDDGQIKYMDTVPANVNGTVFIPLRFAVEALGGTVSWNEDTDTATIIDDNDTITTADDVTIKLTLGSKTALVEDEDADTIFDPVPLLQAPYRDANGRTMVPIRFLSENFGCEVAWIQKWQKVMILKRG